MNKLAHWLFLTQIPDISSRWRWVERTLIVLVEDARIFLESNSYSNTLWREAS